MHLVFWALVFAFGYIKGQSEETLPVPLGIGNKWVYGLNFSPPAYLYEHIDTNHIIDSVRYNVFRYTSPAGVQLRYGRVRWDGYHVVRIEDRVIHDPNKELIYFKDNPVVGESWINYNPSLTTSGIRHQIVGTLFGAQHTYYSISVGYQPPPPLVPSPTVFYSVNFGLKQIDWPGVTYRKLLGAYINGVLYGDTTFYTYVSVKDDAKDIGYILEQNYPNPFNPNTTITYSIEKSGDVRLVIYDCLGNEIKELVNQYMEQGRHTVEVNGSGLGSGVYFYVLQVNGYVLRKSFVLLK